MKKSSGFIVAALLATFSYNACATLVVGGTRLLYDGSKKEGSISVRNPDNTPYLVQTTLDNLDGSTKKPPFVITPPLYRLDGNKENIMRVIMTDALPQDKESMYWMHVKGIPSSPSDKNTLQIAVETTIKLIYRPASMKGTDVEKEGSKLSFHAAGNTLQVTNKAPCFINFNEITVDGKKLAAVSYVAPGSTASFALPAGVTGGAVQYTIISDVGAVGPDHSASI
ncbi:molecular chaperone [Buttiauxella sp. B2]|uniref:fimbrial biogenesis chaperone n=1 Tax=Buttiauxella sp. B2 TaxID=2587812 RepID=UPI001CB981C3|nr:molecular chaperone [Buttiauxella sp. B2]